MKKLSNIFLILLSLASLFPLYVMIVAATQTPTAIYKGEILVPGNMLIENLKTVLQDGFMKYYFNSLFVSVSATVLCVFICAMTGYALAKYDFRFKKIAFAFIIMTMMIPQQSMLVGYVIEMKLLGLNNTLLPLIIRWTTNAFGVFYMTQYVKSSVHSSLLESARIDGCNDFMVFIRIVMPTIKPAIATLSMLVFLWTWNDYLYPLVLISRPNLYTLPLAITNLSSIYQRDYGAEMAALALATVPILIVFILGSKSFIKGLTAGAIKG